MERWRWLGGLLAIAALTAVPTPAGAQTSITRNPEALSDAALDARLAFLEARLDASRTHAWRWQWGWTGAYGMGIVLGTAQAVRADDRAERVDALATAVKGVIGTSRFVFWPHPGRSGADPLRAIVGTSRSARLERLALGEHLLLETRRRATLPDRWIPHLANVGINLAAAGVIAGLGELDDAAISLAIGTVVGEVSIWSAPRAYLKDLEDYEARFAPRTRSRLQWELVPMASGAAVRITF